MGAAAVTTEATSSRAECDPDAGTVARVLGGDIDAYRVLVSAHRDRCLRYAYRMLGDIDDAEDVVQESFVRAYQSLARCQDVAHFGAWLFRILVNRCRTAAARRTRRRLVFGADSLDSDPLGNQHGVETARETGTDFETVEEFERALARLNDAQREAFLLKHIEEMTYEEMATLMGVSVPALKMRVSRACEILRESLAEVYDVP